jgi:hypothetical protein
MLVCVVVCVGEIAGTGTGNGVEQEKIGGLKRDGPSSSGDCFLGPLVIGEGRRPVDIRCGARRGGFGKGKSGGSDPEDYNLLILGIPERTAPRLAVTHREVAEGGDYVSVN